MSKENVSRREFMHKAVVTGAALGAVSQFGTPVFGAGPKYKVGLLGCGGRGNGALKQHVAAANILARDARTKGLGIQVEVYAVADYFRDKALRTGSAHHVPASRCFGGADAYKKLLATDIDIMLTATPPIFRPVHFEAAIRAGKHVFMEKPVAVDPAGIRRVLAAGEAAKKKDLWVVAGTQRRHQTNYNTSYQLVKQGAMGRILGGRVAWNQGRIFSNKPINAKRPEDLCASGKWQLWVEMSGDHLVEQCVHNLDVMNWFMGGHPVAANFGFGYRARRKAGNMYDSFSIDYEFPEGRHIHGMARQVPGTSTMVGEEFTCEKGILKPRSPPRDIRLEEEVRFSEVPDNRSGHQREHINFLYYLTKEKYLNQAKNVAWATGTAIMGRECCFTGRNIKWSDMFENERSPWYKLKLDPQPEDFETGNVRMLKDGDIRIAGKPH